MEDSVKNEAGTIREPVEEKEKQAGQSGQYGYDSQYGQDSHAGQNSRDDQDGHAGQNSRDDQDSHAGQNSRDDQDGHAGQNSRDDQDGHAGQNSQNSQGGQDSQGGLDSPNSGRGKRSAVVEEVISWVKSFILMFCVALFLTQFIIINAVIPTGSMENTIMTRDRLIGARFSYWFSEPQRGDIVIFHYPVNEKKIYIKRVIGLPGDTVRIEGGLIYINDSLEPLQEDYLKEDWEVMNDGLEFHVPEGSYFMLGDNRNWSEDGRYWADNALAEGVADTLAEAEQYSFVRKDRIIGKAIFTYFRKFRILDHGNYGDAN